LEKQETERFIFGEFSKVSPLDIVLPSIESREEPEPDILCKIRDSDSIAFELTEYVPEEYMARFSIYHKTKEKITDIFSSLSSSDQQRFNKIYGDALLHFSFDKNCTLRQKKQILKQHFNLLLQKGASFSGTVMLGSDTRVYIDHGVLGPKFETDNSGWLSDPICRLLLNKFNAGYVTEHPIELIIYSYNFHFGPLDILKAKTHDFSLKNAPTSGIERIWFYSFHKQKIFSCILL